MKVTKLSELEASSLSNEIYNEVNVHSAHDRREFPYKYNVFTSGLAEVLAEKHGTVGAEDESADFSYGYFSEYNMEFQHKVTLSMSIDMPLFARPFMNSRLMSDISEYIVSNNTKWRIVLSGLFNWKRHFYIFFSKTEISYYASSEDDALLIQKIIDEAGLST